MSITPDIRRQYEMERKLAAQIRETLPEMRESVAKAAYSEFYAAFPHPSTRPDGLLGATPQKERLLNALLPQTGHILELGCGYGHTLAALDNARRTLTGIDLSELAIDEAKRSYPQLQFIHGNCISPRTGDDVFDAVFSIDFIEHLHPDDVAAHLASMHQYLKPGGLCVIMTPHSKVGPHDISRFFDRCATGLHLREYSYRDLALIARQAGFAALCTPLFPFRCYRIAPRLVAPTLVRVAWKQALEWIFGALPVGRSACFKALALHTVCLVMHPATRRTRKGIYQP
ncbi:MAG: class I SAM-dependent methyltransferase [bacterium]